MVDRKEDQSTQFRETSSGNFEQAKNIATQTQVDPSLADAQTVAQSLGVDLNTGLSQAEAKRRLDKYGPNELASAPPVPKWKKFLEQFKDPLVYLLLAATGISFVAWFIERANAVPGHRHFYIHAISERMCRQMISSLQPATAQRKSVK